MTRGHPTGRREASRPAPRPFTSPLRRGPILTILADPAPARHTQGSQLAATAHRRSNLPHGRHRIPSRRKSASSSPTATSRRQANWSNKKTVEAYREARRRSNPEAASGRRWPRRTSPGSSRGRRSSTGSRPSPSGSSAPRPTSPTTASTGIWRVRTLGGATRPPSSGRGSPATPGCITYSRPPPGGLQALPNVLKKLGVKKGDRVALYMPMVPEARHRHAGVHPDRCAPQRSSSVGSPPRPCATASTDAGAKVWW